MKCTVLLLRDLSMPTFECSAQEWADKKAPNSESNAYVRPSILIGVQPIKSHA